MTKYKNQIKVNYETERIFHSLNELSNDEQGKYLYTGETK